MRFFYSPYIDSEFELPPDEAAHCFKVLRLRMNDLIDLTDGNGNIYKAEILNINNKGCRVKVLSCNSQEKLWKGGIHVAVSPVKLMDRNEWFVEKAVEIGVDEISFIHTRYSERDSIKMERIERIAIAAMKQSFKARMPIINPIIPFSQFILKKFEGEKFIAHCYDGEKVHLIDNVIADRKSLVMIGPEGDFSKEEVSMAIERDYTQVSLGRFRLRTETAAVVAVHIMNIVNKI
ncbi:MAG TPA: 16S rRNA (uracil(1498)-N(3))-methyltransferase [Bacteroidaceae bacterium]|nr:16S rRNA (uracil(1498)-N(3))-methyltransferase [Bacteroidaceae bacterium]